MKKVYFYGLPGLVVLVSAGYFFVSSSNGKDIKYRTEKASRGSIVVQVRATGNINPVKTVDVGSQVSGIIEKLYVDYNSQVKQNQVIAQIDSTFLYASVKEADANLEHARAVMDKASRDYEREKGLFSKNLVAQADIDAAKSSYESSRADFKSAGAALDRAKVNLQYALIRSPIDGVVISRDVDVGQTVAASFQTPKLFSIANDLRRMQVEASVDEADIGQIASGEDCSFTVDAYPDEQFHGSVSQIRLNPITVQNVVTYTVIIDVPNPDLKLRPGMTATVSILVAKRDNVLRVPALALRFQPPPEALSDESGASDMKAQQGGKSQSGSDMASQGQSQDQGSQAQGQDSTHQHRRMRDQQGNQQGQGMQGGNQAGNRQWGGQGDHQSGDGPRKKMARIWVYDGTKIRQVRVAVGLTDNRYVEVVGPELKEGDDVVLGTIGGDNTAGGQQQNNPFQQRMPGGGGGGRRGM